MAKKQDNDAGKIWGIIAIAVGIIFLLQTVFDIAVFREIWKFWPVVLIVWGVLAIKNNSAK